MDTPWMEQELLAHAAWVRELARGLVGDADSADDLAQDTFVVALRGSPRKRSSMRAWLAGIARRLALKQHRDRPREVPLPDEAPGRASAGSIERLELHELLAKELRALREPLRATLIERYVHGHSAAEIAQHSGLPLPTVRSRLKQGLEELRSRLDRHFQGDRETWMSALAIAARSKGAVLGGSLLVSTISKVSTGLALLVLGVMLARPWIRSLDPPGRERTIPVPTASATLEPSPSGLRSDAQAHDARAEGLASSPPEDVPPDPLRVVASGRCVDLEGRPVAGAEVALTELSWSKRMTRDDPRAADFLTRTRSGLDGRFTITTKLPEPDDGVLVAVEARKPGLCRGFLRTGGKLEGGLELGDIKLGPGTRAAGRVLDALGNPCADALVQSFAKKSATAPYFRDETRSDRDGRFTFECAPAARCTFLASAEDLRSSQLEVDLSAGDPRLDLEIVLPVLSGLDSISGTVLDPHGDAVAKAGLRVTKSAGAGPAPNPDLTCDDHGRFRIDGQPDGVFQLTAYDPDGTWGGVRVDDVRSGAHDLLLRLEGERTFLLRVHDSSGAPIERFGWERGSEAWIWQADREPTNVHPRGELRLPSDVEPFHLRVSAPGWRSSTVGPFDPAATPPTIDVVLERACVLRGTVRSGGKPVRAHVRLAESKLQSSTKPSPLGWASPPSANSDADGHFALTVEGTGSVRLQAERFAGADISAISDPVLIRPGEDVEGLVLEIAPCGSIEGTVIRSDGTPGAGLIVSARRAGKPIRFVSAGEKGSFRIPALSAGTYELVVAAHHLGQEYETGVQPHAANPQHWPCEVSFGQATRADLKLLETARLRVVIDLPKAPRGHWILGVWNHLPRSLGARANSADPGNAEELDFRESSGAEALEFEFVEPFEAVLALDCHQSGWPNIEVERQVVERGARELSVAMSAGRIEGTLVAPLAEGETITLSWTAGPLRASAEVRPDDSGQFAFECAPAGECSLQRRSRPEGVLNVMVKASETVRVDGL